MSEKIGELHLKLGSMYAEKTTELLRHLLKEKASNQRVVFFNYEKDDRNSEDVYSTHNPVLVKNISALQEFPLYKIKKVSEVQSMVDKYDVFGFDEAQFYEDLYVEVVKLVEIHHKIVYVVGLDADKNRCKFGQLLDLIPMADSYEKLYARCMPCARRGKRVQAIHTLCKIQTNKVEQIGGKDIYEAVCRKCFHDAHTHSH